MAKFFTLIVLGVVLGTSAFAQSGSVTGTVLDPEGNPVSFANVLLHSTADSSLVKAGFSDSKGVYNLAPVPEGQYFTRVSFVGYQSHQSEPFAVAKAEVSRPDVQMQEVSTEIKDVRITAEKPLVSVKPDMTVFNVAGTPNAIGENAFDLLRKAPGVMIDNYENIILLGKQGTRIYIDGKPSPLSAGDLANLLKSIQSDQIESFEIITNPSSKFDAEGNAGIINIKFKKDKNLGGNATLSGGYATQIYSKYNGSLSGNYRTKKFNAFGSYSIRNGRDWSYMDSYRTQPDAAGNLFGFDQESAVIFDQTSHNFRVGTDFFLNDKHTIGFTGSGFFSGGNITSTNWTNIYNLETATPNSILIADGTTDLNNANLNGNLNYRYDNGQGTTLNLDADYGTYDNDNNSIQPNVYFAPQLTSFLFENNFTSQTPVDINIYSFKADYERPFWQGKLGLGGKVSYVSTDAGFDLFNLVNGEEILDVNNSSLFNYTENINAAYANFQRQTGKWGWQVGLRAEQTNSIGELSALIPVSDSVVDLNYLNLFPSAGVTYSPSRINSFRLSYSRRIDRPRYQDLNPALQQLSELSFRRGNVRLTPQYTHNIQLTHTYKYTLNTTLSYSRTTDYFTNITSTEGERATFITLLNLSTRSVANLNVSYPRQITKWWSTYTNTGVTYVRNVADSADLALLTETQENFSVDINQWTWNIYHQSTFNLPAKFKLQLSGFYSSPSIWGANFRNRGFGGIEAGVTRRFFNDRATLKVALGDILYTMQWASNQELGDLNFFVTGGWESRRLRFNFSYLFGNNQMKASRKRKTGLEDLGDRAGSGGGNGPGQ
ncbi:MAG: TonB-dependent receptor [Bacteroidota bacterium]